MSLRKSLATLSVLSLLALQVQSGTLPKVNPLVQQANAAQVVASSFSGQTQPLMDCGGGVYCNPGGHWQDLNGIDHGQPAKLLISGLQPGDRIAINNISGMINMGQQMLPCRDGDNGANAVNPKLIAIVQFTDAAGHVVSTGGGINNTNALWMKQFEGAGLFVPAGAVSMYGSFPDSKYSDNSGDCNFTITVTPAGPVYGPCQDIGGPTLQEYVADATVGKITWSFNGGTATYTNNSTCDIVVQAATYQILGNNQQQQFDVSQHVVVPKGTTKVFNLNIPNCDYQIDLQPYWSLQQYNGNYIVHGQVVQHGGVCGQQGSSSSVMSSSSASTTDQGICLSIGGPTLQEYWNDALVHKTTWSFNGGNATYHNGTPCPVIIRGAVYKIFTDNHQELYDASNRVAVNPNETQTFNMQIPNCDYQIDLEPYQTPQTYVDGNGSHAIVHGIIVNNGGRCTTVVSSSSSSVFSSSSSSVSSTPTNADLTLVKTPLQYSVVQGGNVGFSLSVHNNGPAAATNVSVNDPVPAGLTFSPALSDARCFLGTDNAVHCVLGTVQNGATVSAIVVFTTQQPVQNCQQMTVSNTANVSSGNDPSPSNNFSTANVTLTCPITSSSSSSSSVSSAVTTADLSITKVATQSTLMQGSNITYQIAVHNNGPAAAQNVVVTDNVPNGLIYIPSSSDSRCQQNGNTVVCNLGSVSNGTTVTMYLVFSTSAPTQSCFQTTVTNYASVNGSNDPNSSNNVTNPPAYVTLTCPASSSSSSSEQPTTADLWITKTAPQQVLAQGSNVSFQITVHNNGPAMAQNVVVTDNVPNGLTFAPNMSDQRCQLNGTTILCTIGSINNNATTTMNLVFTTPMPTQSCFQTTVTNYASVNGSNDPNSSNNISNPPASVTLICPASSSSSSVSSVIGTGCIDIYKQTYNPQGVLITPTAQFTFQMDGGLTVQNDSSGHVRINGVTVGTHVVTEQIPAGWTQTSVVPSGGYVSVQPSANNQSCAQVAFQDRQNPASSSSASSAGNPDLTITKTGPSSVTRGNNAVYTVTVTNVGQTDAQNVTVTDPIPGGFVFTQSASDSSCSLNGSTVSCNLGTIAAGNSRTIAIGFTVPTINNCTQTSITNTASVSTSSFESNTSNNTAQANPTQVNCPTGTNVDLAIIKSANVTSVNQGNQLTYTLNVQNIGTAQATNVIVTDPFPSQLQYVSSSDGRCSLQNGNTVTCNFGTLAPGASTSTTLTFNVPTISSCYNSMTVTNTAYVSSNETDSNSGNNQSQVITTINCGTSITSCIDIVAEAFDLNGNPVNNVPQFTFRLDNGQTAVNDATGHARFNNVSSGMHYVSEDTRSDWVLYNVTPANGVNVTNGSCATMDFKHRQVFSSTNNFSITIDDGRYTVNPCDNLTYTITVRNNSSTSVNNAVVNATFPDQENIRNVSNGGYNNGRFVTWSNLSFGPYQTQIFTVNADVIGNSCSNYNNCNCYGNNCQNGNCNGNNCYNNNCNNNQNNCYYDQYNHYICNNNNNCYNGDCNGNNCYNQNCNGNNCYNNCNDNYNYNGSLTATATIAGNVANDTDVIQNNVCNNCRNGNNAELSLHKDASAAEVFPGGMIEYTVRLENTGNTTLHNIRVTDDLPSGVTVIDDGGADNHGGNELDWSINSLSMNASRTITYRVTLGSYYAPGQIVRNNVEARADQNVDEHASTTVQVIGMLPQTGFPGMNDASGISLHPITGNTTAGGFPLSMAVWLSLAGLGTGAGMGFGRKFLLGL